MDEKDCVMCVHYNQHYVKTNTFFMQTMCGHCDERKLTKKNLNTKGPCAFFSKRNLVEEQKEIEQDITSSFNNIAMRIKALYAVLEND